MVTDVFGEMTISGIYRLHQGTLIANVNFGKMTILGIYRLNWGNLVTDVDSGKMTIY